MVFFGTFNVFFLCLIMYVYIFHEPYHSSVKFCVNLDTCNLPGTYNIKQTQNTGGKTGLIFFEGSMARYSNHHSAPMPIGYSGKNIEYRNHNKP